MAGQRGALADEGWTQRAIAVATGQMVLRIVRKKKAPTQQGGDAEAMIRRLAGSPNERVCKGRFRERRRSSENSEDRLSLRIIHAMADVELRRQVTGIIPSNRRTPRDHASVCPPRFLLLGPFPAGPVYFI